MGNATNEERPASLAAVLPRNKQLAFVILVFERMLPNLLSFSEDTGFESDCYLEARNEVWAALQDRVVDKQMGEECLRRAPDTEKFTHRLTSQALNAALAIADILEFVHDGRADHITYICSLARDSVHLYLSSFEVSSVPTSEDDARIAAHPLMQGELRREEDDLAFIAELPDHFDRDTVLALRKRATMQCPLTG